MKNKMTIIIIGGVIVILLGSLIYMRLSCAGLWERQVSKIPSNSLSKKEGEPDDYTKCVYIGFSGMVKKWKAGDFPWVRAADTPPLLQESSDITTHQYKSIKPGFSFKYPNLEGHTITTGSNYIKYDIQPSELSGPTGAQVQWDQVYIKVTVDYWDTQKVNKNGIQYNLSEDENFLDFRLFDQGTVIRFNVSLPGGYQRKKLIIDTIVDSFEEVKNK